MKRAYKIAALIFLICTVSVSCTKDLNFGDYNKLPQAKFWQTKDDAMAALVACYGDLSGWSFVDPSTLGPEQMASDNTAKGSTVGSQSDLLAFQDFSFTPSLSRFNNLWISRYSLINKCNQVLKYVPGMNIDQTDKNEILGEARFIRAWEYFELVRLFGPVVVYDGIPANGAYDIPKSSVADVYKFILSDLDFGWKNMRKQPWGPQWKGRVTAWAARALEAKVLMYMASGPNFMQDGKAIDGKTWNDVEQVTNDVIQNGPYHLMTARGDSSFFYLFRLQYENCDESIFEVQNGSSTTVSAVNRSPYVLNTWIKAGRDGGFGYSVPSDNLVAAWKKRYQDQHDLRYKYSVIFKGDTLVDGLVVDGASSLEGITGTPRYNYKVYIPKNEQTNIKGGGWIHMVEQNERLYRYSDLLLIDAEAKFRLGDKAGAAVSINKVRVRAGEPPLAPSDLTLQKIWDERRFELAFENDRYFDLIRTGQAKTVLGPRGWTFPKNVFYPIPQNQIDLSNGKLTQNPNW
ncbi:MAG TPA: RagB/SusD family nutrient uptake outer membrane protein [Balneolales bacterium]|nr:RagB/SusD family nutrient uptake outer membrane protein [Balneolales bacterium]